MERCIPPSSLPTYRATGPTDSFVLSYIGNPISYDERTGAANRETGTRRAPASPSSESLMFALAQASSSALGAAHRIQVLRTPKHRRRTDNEPRREVDAVWPRPTSHIPRSVPLCGYHLDAGVITSAVLLEYTCVRFLGSEVSLGLFPPTPTTRPPVVSTCANSRSLGF